MREMPQVRPAALSTQCKAIHETCATRASIHHKTECTVINPDDFRCVNCGHKQGHAAWDKSCPAYQRALVKLRARGPGSGFRLFPLANDPYYSWEGSRRRRESLPGGRRTAVGAPTLRHATRPP